MDEVLPVWDDTLSDRELSELLDSGAELNIAMVQDLAVDDTAKRQEAEIQLLGEQVNGLSNEKEELKMELQEMERVKHENEQLKSEIHELKLAKGEVLESVGSKLIESAL